MFRAVIFDMDGVIIDSEPIYFRAGKKLFKHLGLDIPEEEHHAYVGISSRDMWSSMKDKYRIELSIEQLVEMETKISIDDLLSKKDEKPIAGVVELLEDLYRNHIRLALASSSAIGSIETILNLFKIKRYFDVAVSGYEVDHGKPAPDIFVYAAKRLNVRPDECMAIEDSANGVEAAKSAGMKCIGFRNPNSGSQDLSSADRIIDTFSLVNYRKLQEIFDSN